MSNKILQQSRKPVIIRPKQPTVATVIHNPKPQQIKPQDKMQDTMQNKMQDKIRDAIIEPIKIANKNNKLNNEFDAKKSDYKNEITELWKQRTDDPYKIIIKDKYIKGAKSTKDLIVHTVTDKDKKDSNKKFQEYNQTIEKHNNELKMIYSLSNESKNKESFTYNVVYGNRSIYNPKDHVDMKSDQIKYYIDQQKAIDSDKKRIDNLIEDIVNEGIFGQNQKK